MEPWLDFDPIPRRHSFFFQKMSAVGPTQTLKLASAFVR